MHWGSFNAGGMVTGSKNANCISQDDTEILTLINLPPKTLEDNTDFTMDYIIPGQSQHIFSGCRDTTCVLCESLRYISGFCVWSTSKNWKCGNCKKVMHSSLADPCPSGLSKSLILEKSYNKELALDYQKKGIVIPSGSVFNLIKLCEKWLRSCSLPLHTKNLIGRIVNGIISWLASPHRFTGFKRLECDHDWLLAHAIIEKFVVLRVRKVFNDRERERDKGSYLNWCRIFQNV